MSVTTIPIRAVPAIAVLILTGLALASGEPPMRTENFDRDPAWDHSNNRPADRNDRPVTIREDFGLSRTSHAGGREGQELGGYVQAAAEPAWFGAILPRLTFDTSLSASGTLAVADGGTHLLLGFFNAATTNEWRTPNTLVLRINGRGDHFLAYLEYCTSKWRAGGDSPQSFPTQKDPRTGRQSLLGFASGLKVHRWEIRYDPAGHGGAGVLTASLDGQTAACDLAPGHKADGAVFDRFGILNVSKSADNGTNVFVGNVIVNGQRVPFDAPGRWDGRNNRRTFQTMNVRPHFDFGYSPTHFAGGKAAGEMGGLVFRGDCRFPQRMACYADRVGPLKLDKPLRASGRLAMLRGVTDSTTLFGFFNRAAAMRSNPSQTDGTPAGVLGINIEGPSRTGFCFYPVYRGTDVGGRHPRQFERLRVFPDGASHAWSLEYDPAAAQGRGSITVSLDGRSIRLDLNAHDKSRLGTFDRFGVLTTWIDGNGQLVYFDDLTYTCRQ